MKRPLHFALILLFLTIVLGFDKGPPEASISNGIIKAKLYLPDATNGYYRGARFDWSGVIYDLEYDKHHYFGQWFEHYEPTLHDAIMGPVDSFNPIGYDEAKIGEGFLRIGVGTLEKPDEPKYFYSNPYKILNGGTWTVKKKSSSITFTHELKTEKYNYLYIKNVSLTRNDTELVLEYRLINNGETTLETDVYNHNFFVIDNQPTGPDFIVKFPFNMKGTFEGSPDKGGFSGQNIVYKRMISKGEFLGVFPLTGYGSTMNDYDFRIENKKTGAGVRITGDKPLTRLNFWSAPATICPEPFINVKVEPGKEMTWRIRYEFYSKF